ncbi:MAG: PilC/PilY family type IV pilus protein [Polyangiaceae bacterium]
MRSRSQRRSLGWLGALVCGGVTLTLAAPVQAQVDVNPPLPNVMFLVDTSGSMEYLASSTTFPTCNPTGSNSQKSRWTDLVEVMTGSVQNYRCYAQSRSSSAFADEYRLPGLPQIYDYQYTNPYHRILSGTCTPGPNPASLTALQTAPYSYPTDWLKFHTYNSTTACTTFQQANDGLLDTFRGRVRFGLMTFDTHTDDGTGLAGSTANFPSGMRGTWSYYVGGAKAGHPAGCTTGDYVQEVGARNAAAPPWEGRMVAFGSPNATQSDLQTRADWIQNVLLTTRPYGATPIAGMLSDAYAFFNLDTSQDPLDTSQDFGPRSDPFVDQGCRKNVIVLLTDGEPNLDLRPFCESGGHCPYERSEDIAKQFDADGTPVFVIGFAVNSVNVGGTTLDCSDLDLAQAADQTLCSNPANATNRELQACCTLSRIAYNGGTDRAYFPTNRDELRQALSNILSQLVPTTSRTLPVFAGTGDVRNGFAGSYRVLTSFTPKQFDTWSAVLERQRIVCKTPSNPSDPIEPELEAIDPAKGDDFVKNVNDNPNGRKFYSVLGTNGSSGILSDRSIRPLTIDDGIGVYSGTQYSGDASAFVTATPAAAASITAGDCVGASTATQCRDRILKWTVGLPNGTIYNRCSGTTCNLIGDIYHSTPRVVGSPSDIVRDESYDAFAIEQIDRPLVLYTSTNDGFLHAFDMNVGAGTSNPVGNNELWAFVPPAVLTGMKTQYPGLHKQLLDGVPVIRDVVATANGSTFKLERSAADAQDGAGRWRTILIQSFGSASTRGGYFALDVTDPKPNSSGTKGPKFLWQLTTTDAGDPLFGPSTPTPLITTLFFGDPAKEVAVAVLPGGDGGQRLGTNCTRTIATPNSAYPARGAVRCYDSGADSARSLTIVRLDTGEVIRTFRPAGLVPGNLAARTTETDIESPITGQPVAYPGDTGTVADRIFVGDRDGSLWRVNTSSTNPADWEMDLFWDAYPTSLSFSAASGQPIVTPPVLSVDGLGQLTIAFSTGDQETFTAANQTNFVWSLTETVSTNGKILGSKANWFTRLDNGERVAGPISLFNGALFYSTFQPETSASQVCNAGDSRVWGVDYLIPKTDTNLGDGGSPRLPEDPNATAPTFVQYISASTSTLIDNGSTIFGVGVAQLPTCNEVDTGFSDPYLGSGAHRSVSRVNPGKFQLVMHTGAGGTAIGGGKTKTLSFDLPAPPAIATIDSWAALVEGL